MQAPSCGPNSSFSKRMNRERVQVAVSVHSGAKCAAIGYRSAGVSAELYTHLLGIQSDASGSPISARRYASQCNGPQVIHRAQSGGTIKVRLMIWKVGSDGMDRHAVRELGNVRERRGGMPNKDPGQEIGSKSYAPRKSIFPRSVAQSAQVPLCSIQGVRPTCEGSRKSLE